MNLHYTHNPQSSGICRPYRTLEFPNSSTQDSAFGSILGYHHTPFGLRISAVADVRDYEIN